MKLLTGKQTIMKLMYYDLITYNTLVSTTP